MENEGQACGPSAFGTLLRRFRITAGLSQEALAERARMSREGVSALERGFRRTPQRETLALLAARWRSATRTRRELRNAAARWVLLRRGGRASVTWVRGPIGPPRTCRSRLFSFVGREVELDEIAALVREHRLVTLTGSGRRSARPRPHCRSATGSGDAPARVWLVGLAPISDPSLVPAAIASALRVQEVPNRPLFETLLACLKNKTVLLILDNCEHVVTRSRDCRRAPVGGLSARSYPCH